MVFILSVSITGREERRMDSEKVQISTRLLVALVLILFGCVAIIAYLLGRESIRNAPQSATQQATPPAAMVPTPVATYAVAPSAPPPAWTPPPQLPETHVTYAPATPDSPPSQAAPTGPPGQGGNSLVSAEERAVVQNYFTRSDEAATSAKYWDDPNAMAQECLKAAMNGDTSGIERLISAYRTVQQKTMALDAPGECAEHKKRSIEILGQSIKILESMKRGISSGDVSAMQSLAGEAGMIKAKADNLDSLTRRIKTKYGIKQG
jgi:hypothetical protein